LTVESAVRPGHHRRRLRIALTLLASLLIVFALVSARLFIWPAQGMPAHVDAIIMFAGSDDRLGTALQLAKEHRAPVLVISRGREGYGAPCPRVTLKVKLICFDPDPPNTRGEAEFAGRLARQDHWKSLVLVTGRFQVTRARLLMSQCFGGLIYVVPVSLAWSEWPVRFAYEWGALAKALILHQAC
jgi:uncharacterized SAM-binding protein YcdF (DUF218 family)